MNNIKPIVMALAIVSLASCSIAPPNYESAEDTGCWRYGVNTDVPMVSRDVFAIPVVKLGQQALADACGVWEVDSNTLGSIKILLGVNRPCFFLPPIVARA
jgi:hypothetical protein